MGWRRSSENTVPSRNFLFPPLLRFITRPPPNYPSPYMDGGYGNPYMDAPPVDYGYAYGMPAPPILPPQYYGNISFLFLFYLSS